jgi:hypothetical protein
MGCGRVDAPGIGLRARGRRRDREALRLKRPKLGTARGASAVAVGHTAAPELAARSPADPIRSQGWASEGERLRGSAPNWGQRACPAAEARGWASCDAGGSDNSPNPFAAAPPLRWCRRRVAPYPAHATTAEPGAGERPTPPATARGRNRGGARRPPRSRARARRSARRRAHRESRRSAARPRSSRTRR